MCFFIYVAACECVLNLLDLLLNSSNNKIHFKTSSIKTTVLIDFLKVVHNLIIFLYLSSGFTHFFTPASVDLIKLFFVSKMTVILREKEVTT